MVALTASALEAATAAFPLLAAAAEAAACDLAAGFGITTAAENAKRQSISGVLFMTRRRLLAFLSSRVSAHTKHDHRRTKCNKLVTN